MKFCPLLFGLFAIAFYLPAQTDELPDLNSLPRDLEMPLSQHQAPAPGMRVWRTAPGWENSGIQHLLFLPEDWQEEKSLPVIVEYPGNGNYRDKNGDVSDGLIEGCRLGFGITAGRGAIWLSLPYLERKDGQTLPCIRWWGDLEETERYCLAALEEVFARYGGDADRVILAGFSRGSIGCHFFGLRNERIAALWAGFICHSHFDGVRESWPYPGADRASALQRLKRLNERPEFISHEGSTQLARQWLESTGVRGNWTFVDLPYRNHTNTWVLHDIPERQRLREWFAQFTEKK